MCSVMIVLKNSFIRHLIGANDIKTVKYCHFDAIFLSTSETQPHYGSGWTGTAVFSQHSYPHIWWVWAGPWPSTQQAGTESWPPPPATLVKRTGAFIHLHDTASFHPRMMTSIWGLAHLLGRNRSDSWTLCHNVSLEIRTGYECKHNDHCRVKGRDHNVQYHPRESGLAM